MREKIKILMGGILIGVLMATAVWFVSVPGQNRATNERPASKNEPQIDATRSTSRIVGSDNDQVSPAQQLSADVTRSPERWRSIAKHTSLQLTVDDFLTVNRAVIDLLGLNPTQAEDLNDAVSRFAEALRSEELKHARVDMSGGGEAIVVAPFDRSNLIETLRDEVSATLGSEVGDFIAEQVVFDRAIAANDGEVQVSIERGEDGPDRVNLTQHVLRRDAVDAQTPIRDRPFELAPTYELRTEFFLEKDTNSRYSHLFSAADRLPRQ